MGLKLMRLALPCTVLVCVGFPSRARAGFITVDFEGLPAMTYIAGSPIPSSARLSDQLLSTYGVRFSSGGGYVAVVQLGAGHATSGVNGIGGSNASGTLTYNGANPIVIEFFDPTRTSVAALTDFVSIRGDLIGNSGESPTLQAFDLSGNLIGSSSLPDTGGQTWSISAPGIHSVRFSGVNRPDSSGGGVALDDLTYSTLSAVPEPSGLVLFGIGTGLMVAGYRRRYRAEPGAAADRGRM